MAEEKKLQNSILADLRSFGKYCDCFKIIRTSDNGVMDIFFTTALTGGVLVELKKEKGKARALQKSKIESFTNNGTPSYLCHTWDEWIGIKSKLDLTFENVSNFYHKFVIVDSIL